jgi:RimJ/RimL family protein N-acetyltransferase
MAAGVANHAFTDVGLPGLVAFTRVENAASRRVLEKVGFGYERHFVDDGVSSVLYRRIR